MAMKTRQFSTSTSSREKQKQSPSTSTASSDSGDDHNHDHTDSHSHSSITNHSHSHSHSIFHSHSHSTDDGGHHHHHQDPEEILAALRGRGDRGSRVTLLGLVANVGLTGAKGAAGWYMNSAALLAEAGHSASDLLGDLVTLFAWRFSRRPPTPSYPYGFGKFETIGSTTVALILIAGALGIGAHSCTLLAHALGETANAMPPGPAQEVLRNVTSVVGGVASSVPGIHSHSHSVHTHPPHPTLHEHDHSHHHAESVLDPASIDTTSLDALALDPNAAWFALLSIIIKEWLYRITVRVARDESSPVLLANALHHRADAYTSFVALLAILGSWMLPAIPLDPIGGLVVACVIMRQGGGLFWSGLGELTDHGVKPKTLSALRDALLPLVGEGQGRVRRIENLRAMRAGGTMFVDVSVLVPREMTIEEAQEVERAIAENLRGARKEVREVRVKFVPFEDDLEEDEKHDEAEEERGNEHGHNHGHEEKPNGGLR